MYVEWMSLKFKKEGMVLVVRTPASCVLSGNLMITFSMKRIEVINLMMQKSLVYNGIFRCSFDLDTRQYFLLLWKKIWGWLFEVASNGRVGRVGGGYRDVCPPQYWWIWRHLFNIVYIDVFLFSYISLIFIYRNNNAISCNNSCKFCIV